MWLGGRQPLLQLSCIYIIEKCNISQRTDKSNFAYTCWFAAMKWVAKIAKMRQCNCDACTAYYQEDRIVVSEAQMMAVRTLNQHPMGRTDGVGGLCVRLLPRE